MLKWISFSGLILLIGLQSFNRDRSTSQLDKIDISEMPIEQVLINLDNQPYIHSMERHDEKKAQIGYELITQGRTTQGDKKTKRISPYFVCTDCHNLTREFENIASEDPQERLDYAVKNGLTFLPASTFWGIYNRTTFYNGDYDKKYGEMVVGARDTLENAIQLCAKYCSSGRYLEDWELEAIMHYYKQNELRVKDISISENDRKNILYYQKLKPDEKKRLTEVVNASHVQGYEATFLPAMDLGDRKYGEGGNAENGEKIYNNSCLHCHLDKRVTYLHLDNDKLSARMFMRNLKNYSDKSLYQIVRYGTYSKKGRKQYMPLYTEEKMSDEQLNDLIAYLRKLAQKK